MGIAGKAFLWSVVFAVSIYSFANAQSFPSLEGQLQNWENTPEDPATIQECASDLKYAHQIVKMNTQGADIHAMMRWAEHQSETVVLKQSIDPSGEKISAGENLHILRLILIFYQAKPEYSLIRGGFVHWVYHSCRINKSLGY